MGIGFRLAKSHQDHESIGVGAQWSYSGFNSFRQRLAADIGIDLTQMDGFGGEQRSWDTVNDPLKDLLNHSDCDGHLTAEQCAVIGPRLKELAEKWDENEGIMFHDKPNALKLAVGMEAAATHKYLLMFC
jgi:hypothetical protein